MFDNTEASSLIKCGRLPVFSSCSMTPVTMSSLMLSVSTLLSKGARGEGGGVFSYAALPLLFGRSAKETTFGCDEDVEDRGPVDVVGEEEFEGCDRLIFLVGGGCGVSVVDAALDTEGR